MTLENPSNQDILNSFQHHADEDAKFQGETNEVHKAIIARMDTFATKEDVREIFSQELQNFFKVGFLRSKTTVITVATIIGALVVIFGGLKTFLSWVGFHYLGK